MIDMITMIADIHSDQITEKSKKVDQEMFLVSAQWMKENSMCYRAIAETHLWSKSK